MLKFHLVRLDSFGVRSAAPSAIELEGDNFNTQEANLDQQQHPETLFNESHLSNTNNNKTPPNRDTDDQTG